VLRMVVRTREYGIFPRTAGSSPRIGVCPVIGGPTVRLAKLFGTERGGAGSVGLTATAAFTVRLRGWATAPGRPPPAVRPFHLDEKNVSAFCIVRVLQDQAPGYSLSIPQIQTLAPVYLLNPPHPPVGRWEWS
jgi:hypothetical protein